MIDFGWRPRALEYLLGSQCQIMRLMLRPGVQQDLSACM